MLKQKRWLIPVLILAVILIAAGAGFFLSRPQGNELPASVTIVPEGLQITGADARQAIPVDSSFLVESQFSISEGELRGLVELEPPVPFTVTGGGKSFRIKPDAPLSENMVYTFRVKNGSGKVVQSFAFQTKSDLLVESTYPADGDYVSTNDAIQVVGDGTVSQNTVIEVTFNAPDVDMSGSFEILPNTAGHFEVNDHTAVFIPAAPLQPGSIYRVTLRAGLEAPNKTALKEDYTFSFETASTEEKEMESLRPSGGFVQTALPGDPLSMGFWVNDDKILERELQVDIYKFPGINSFGKEVKAYYSYYDGRYGQKDDYTVPFEGLEQTGEYTSKLLQSTQGDYLVPLPSSLSEGQYLVNVSLPEEAEEPPLQMLLQLANVSVYAQSANGDTVIWLNDPVSGEPMGKTHLSLENTKDGGKQEGDTLEDGTFRLLTGEQEAAYLTVIRDGSAVWFDRVSLNTVAEPSLEENYYTAVYTDRELYQADDTIRFWGVVRPRRVTSPLPEEVYAVLRTGWPEGETARVKAQVAGDGTFEGSVSLAGMRKGYYTFALTAGGDEDYRSKSLQIMEYTKPAYTLSVTPDKQYYNYREKAEFTVRASFYDGTPVSGGKLRMSGDSLLFENGGEETEFTLDADGKAAVRATIMPYVSGEPMDWTPREIYYWVSSADEQDMMISEQGHFTALPSKVAMELKSESPDKVAVRTALLDVSKLESRQGGVTPYPIAQLPSEFERLAGGAVDVDVTVLVHQVQYTRTQTGSYYDSVNKETVPVYKTDRTESILQTLRGRTQGGTLRFDELPYEQTEDTYYWFELRADGGVIGEVKSRQDDGILRFSGPEEEPRYTFFGEEGGPAVRLDQEFTVGLYNNGRKAQNEGRVFCSVISKKVLESGVFATDTQNITFKEEDLPGIWLVGAYFDGRHVYPIRRESVRYDYSEKALKLSVSTDKPSYRPGDTAQVTLTVTDENGAPRAASACIGVVDEAVFGLEEQELLLAEQLYGNLFYVGVRQYTSYGGGGSYAVPNTGGGAESADAMAMDMGAKAYPNSGGGETRVRERFADTASFTPVEVGSSGKISVPVTLPDNVTSWRFTAAAVTEDLFAGDTRGKAAATQPFFLTPLFTDRYLAGDDLALSAGAAGDAVKEGGQVEYTLTVADAAGKELQKKTASGDARARTAFNLGKLQPGAYTLTLEGSSGEHKDAVKQPFTVIDSGITVPVIESGLALPETAKIKSAKYPVQVTVYNEALLQYMGALDYLAGRGGERTELLAGAYRARVLQNQLLPKEQQETIRRDSRLDEIQTSEGGVRILPAAEADASVTAKILLASPELISGGAAKEYLQSVLSDPAATPDHRIMAYVGMAALREPVLLDLNRLLEREDLTAMQRLYLGAGLAELGDTSGAGRVYEQEAKAALRDGELRYLEGDQTADSRVDTTAAALTLASLIGHEDAEGYLRFLMAQQEGQRGQVPGEPFQLAVLTWCENFQPPKGADRGKFSYTEPDGTQREAGLTETGYATLSLDARGLQSANLKTVSGKLYASVSYLGYAQPQEDNSHQLTVEKTMTPISGEEIRVGDRVRVDITLTFDDSAPEGCYNITDYLPSGLRYLPDTAALPMTDRYTGSMEEEGQVIRGYVYRSKPEEADQPAETLGKAPADARDIPVEDDVMEDSAGAGEGSPNVYKLSYFAAAVLPGEFVNESVYVSPEKEGVFAQSGRGELTVLPAGEKTE